LVRYRKKRLRIKPEDELAPAVYGAAVAPGLLAMVPAARQSGGARRAESVWVELAKQAGSAEQVESAVAPVLSAMIRAAQQPEVAQQPGAAQQPEVAQQPGAAQ